MWGFVRRLISSACRNLFSASEPARPLRMCEFRTCGKVAEWAYIGRTSELYVCEDHYNGSSEWQRIESVRSTP